jgi:RNA polymerase sigma-70 factor (ECF subfamily)
VQETGVLYLEPAENTADLATRKSDRVGVSEAFDIERIARRELPRVEGLLRRMLGPRNDLDDLVQNVFLEMCRALPNFRGDSSVSTFVGGITVRIARRAMRPSAWTRFRGPMPDVPPVGPDRPEDNAVASEQLRRLDVALGKISADKRIAFVLWAVDGKDVETISEMVGASVPATRSRIHYAQRELKTLAATDPYLKDLLDEADDAG